MAYDFINKNCDKSPELIELLPDHFCLQWRERQAAGETKLRVKYSGVNGGQFNVSGFKPKTADIPDSPAHAVPDNRPSADKSPKAPFILKPRGIIDPNTIPPREWLGGGQFYMRRTVSATVGPGDYGKTTLSILDAVVLSTGRKLLDEQPPEKLRVWYHSGEDPPDELDRRFAAVCLYYDIPPEEIADLIITTAQTVPLRVAEGFTEFIEKKELIQCIDDQIGANRIDVAILEPLITLHGVPESDNSKMDRVVRIFGSVSANRNCSIGVNAHTRKGANGDETHYDINDLRGASAIRDAVRAARVLNRATKEEIAEWGQPEHERARYVRIDRAKGNNSPTAPTRWVTFDNVVLPQGDDVGVMTLWTPPDQHGPEARAAREQAKWVFLTLLRRFLRNERRASERKGFNYAPKLFATEREARDAKVSQAMLEGAMRELLDEGKIRGVDEGAGGHLVHRLVIV
jgi:RecA-family ATPase